MCTHTHVKAQADLVQEMPIFPAWPRSSMPLARFSSAMGHSALGASVHNWLFTSTQQGAAGKACIWRRSFFLPSTASLHLQNNTAIMSVHMSKAQTAWSRALAHYTVQALLSNNSHTRQDQKETRHMEAWPKGV